MEKPEIITKDIKSLLKCPICDKEFIEAWDDYSESVSKYLFEPNCDHYKPGIKISVG